VTQLCLNFIVATGQAAAQSIHDAIAAGTSFAAADAGPGANANSPAGGEGPCVFPNQIASQLGPATATVVEGLADGQLAPPQEISVPNQVTGQTQTIWLVIAVRTRNLVSFADTESGLRQEMLAAGGPSLSAALGRAVKGARVDLDPQYGVWSAGHGVVAPTPPRPGLVLNAAVDGSSTGSSILGSVGQSSG
jgi:hypothetical protein